MNYSKRHDNHVEIIIHYPLETQLRNKLIYDRTWKAVK